jgi:hypothetical protein
MIPMLLEFEKEYFSIVFEKKVIASFSDILQIESNAEVFFTMMLSTHR